MSENRKLELSDICAYLPHGLKVKILNANCDYVGIEESVLNGFYYLGGQPHFTYNGGSTGKSVSEFKPYLRPLSSLTKEIHRNGKCFIPIIELLKLKYPQQPKEGKYSEIKFDSEGYPQAYYFYSANRQIKVRPHEMNEEPHWVINKLHEWFFDTNNLLSAGLAIELKY